MNKTLWQVLIIGAAAEVIMFAALIYRHMPVLNNIANGYLYIFALMFFYLSVLRMFKSYKAAFVPSVIAAVVPAFGFIYAVQTAYLAAALFCGMSFFAYTFCGAKGLKHNQGNHFFVLSLLLFAAALYCSAYSAVLPLFILLFDKTGGTKVPLKRTVFFFVLAVCAVTVKAVT